MIVLTGISFLTQIGTHPTEYVVKVHALLTGLFILTVGIAYADRSVNYPLWRLRSLWTLRSCLQSAFVEGTSTGCQTQSDNVVEPGTSFRKERSPCLKEPPKAASRQG